MQLFCCSELDVNNTLLGKATPPKVDLVFLSQCVEMGYALLLKEKEKKSALEYVAYQHYRLYVVCCT